MTKKKNKKISWIKIFLNVLLLALIIFLSINLYFSYQEEKVALEKTFYKNNEYVIETKNNGNRQKFYYGANNLMEKLESYLDIRKNLIDKKETFLDLNLQTMKISFFKKGKKVIERKIAGKGRPGGWWETPPGIYRIIEKREQVKVAKSSDENPVFMPYAMRFNGMFFIHSWPEFKDGTELSGYYTEGCIRLKKKVAKEFYSMIPVGTTVLVYDEKKDDFKYKKYNITSDTFIATDILNNEILFVKNPDSIVKLGDITKFLLYLSITDWVELPFKKKVKSLDYIGEKEWIKIGKEYRMFDLGFPLLARKSDQVASEITKRFEYIDPVTSIKQKAKSVGMKNTYINNPIGDRYKNTSTITDIVMLMKYLYKSRDFILYMSRGKVKDMKYGKPVWGDVPQKSKFKNIDGYIGGITSDNFGKDFQYGVGIFKIKINNNTRPIAIVIYNSKDIESDAKNILKKITTFYNE